MSKKSDRAYADINSISICGGIINIFSSCLFVFSHFLYGVNFPFVMRNKILHNF